MFMVILACLCNIVERKKTLNYEKNCALNIKNNDLTLRKITSTR